MNSLNEKNNLEKKVKDILLFYSSGNYEEVVFRTKPLIKKYPDIIELYNLLKDSFESERFNLLESLGQKILSDIIKKYDSVYHVTLNIRKPSIIMDNNKDFINVEVEYTK